MHVPDDASEYPVGTRLDVIGAVGSDAVDVEANPYGRYRVTGRARLDAQGRAVLALTLQLVR